MNSAAREQRWSKWIFHLLLLFQLLYVWQQKYFLTADGPAHIYNAKVLLDFFTGSNTAFYSVYYDLRLELFPNWFTHAALALLMLICNPFVAEKILVSGYAILFALSLRFMARQWSGSANPFTVLVFLFVFHYLLYFGFYNYCFSIPFAFVFIGYWKKLRNQAAIKQLVVLVPLATLLSFTHLFGWFISGIFLSSVFIIEHGLIIRRQTLSAALNNFRKSWLVLLAISVVFLSLCFLYMHQNAAELQYFPEETNRQWQAVSSLEMLTLWGMNTEKFLVQSIVWLLLILAAAQIIYRIKNRIALTTNDAWLVSAIVFVLIYFKQPVFLCLGGFWAPRMSWMGWFMLAVWLAHFRTFALLEKAGVACITLLIIGLGFVRFPLQQKTSDALSDYLSAIPHIPVQSKILPLSFSHFGKDEYGHELTTVRKQFQHAFDYCGAVNPVINLANYEAGTAWFPLRWKQQCNPIDKLNKGNGIEAQPPNANLLAADTSDCSYNIDYVITWCMSFADSNTMEFKSVSSQLQEGYTKVYQSGSHRTCVWRRK